MSHHKHCLKHVLLCFPCALPCSSLQPSISSGKAFLVVHFHVFEQHLVPWTAVMLPCHFQPFSLGRLKLFIQQLRQENTSEACARAGFESMLGRIGHPRFTNGFYMETLQIMSHFRSGLIYLPLSDRKQNLRTVFHGKMCSMSVPKSKTCACNLVIAYRQEIIIQ